jgi:drug/metabolite transporter (DMT)-like permease
MPPLAAASLRFILASCVLLLWLTRTGRIRSLLALSPQQWLGMAIASSVGVLGYSIFFMLALKTVPASRATMVVALNPVLTMIFAALKTPKRLQQKALIYGIIDASSTHEWLAPSVVFPIIFGVAVITVFLVLEARSSHASFDVSLFRNRGYAVSLAAVSMAFFALSGITFTLPFYLQIVRGYSVIIAGVCFLPFAIGQLMAAPQSARLVARFGYKAVMTTGLTLVAIALFMLGRAEIDSPLWSVLAVFFIFGVGMGCVIAPGSTILQNVLPLAKAGAGSAVQNTVRQVGGALGVAIIGTILANQYAANVATALGRAPVAFPEAAKQAASESLIASVAVLDKAVQSGLPADTAETLRQGAYEAFLSASHVTSYISCAVIAIAALVVAFLLPAITPPSAHGPAVPRDATDKLVQDEVANYPREEAEQFGVVDGGGEPTTRS